MTQSIFYEKPDYSKNYFGDEQSFEPGAHRIPFDQAKTVPITTFFEPRKEPYTLERGMNVTALPKRDMINLLIPYEVMEHRDHIVGEQSIASIIEEHVNTHFGSSKYIYSCHPGRFLALEFETYSFDLLEEVEANRMTTPMVLFDDAMNQFFIFDFDMCVTIYGRLPSLADQLLNGQPDSFWHQYFHDHFIEGTYKNFGHINRVNTLYVSEVPGIEPSWPDDK